MLSQGTSAELVLLFGYAVIMTFLTSYILTRGRYTQDRELITGIMFLIHFKFPFFSAFLLLLLWKRNQIPKAGNFP